MGQDLCCYSCEEESPYFLEPISGNCLIEDDGLRVCKNHLRNGALEVYKNIINNPEMYPLKVVFVERIYSNDERANKSETGIVTGEIETELTREINTTVIMERRKADGESDLTTKDIELELRYA